MRPEISYKLKKYLFAVKVPPKKVYKVCPKYARTWDIFYMTGNPKNYIFLLKIDKM